MKTKVTKASTPLSRKSFNAECLKHGVTPPKSLAKDSEEFAAWLRKYGDSLPFARDISTYRSANTMLKKLEAMKIRTMPNGRMNHGTIYHGSFTGREAGGGGVNILNMHREEKFGVDLRGMFEAPDGYQLGVCDLNAIEPRALAVLGEDWEMVEKLQGGMDIYEAYARAQESYTDPRPLKQVDPKWRQACKASCLSLGYGAGAIKAQAMFARDYGIPLSLAEAEKKVYDFRSRKYTPALWGKLEDGMRKSAGGDHTIELPSGRLQHYRNVKSFGSLSAIVPWKGNMVRLKFWGGSLCAELIQATARDVLMGHLLEANRQGMDVLFACHDEIVVLLKEEEGVAGLEQLKGIMSVSPAWLPDLPVAAEGFLTKKYRK